MKTNTGIVVVILLTTLGFVERSSLSEIGKTNPREHYGLLTRDYGIVTEDDLAFDGANREIPKHNPNNSLSGLYWQCFPNKVKIQTGCVSYFDSKCDTAGFANK